MADTKITALTAITTVDPAADVLPIVDVSDTSMAASGTTKKITSNQILGAGGTATLASATITGDLTVDTNTLYVNSSTNNVGLGTLTPSGASGRALEIYGGAGQSRLALKNDTTGSASTDGSQIALVGSQLVIQNREASEITFETNNSERYRIASDGVATWSNVGGVAGTAMTLNSTGLGVGVTPSAWNTIGPVLQIEQASLVSEASNQLYLSANAYFASGNWNYINNSQASQYYQSAGSHVWRSATASTGTISFSTLMTLDASGNLILQSSATPATLTTNGQLTVNATSNTNLRFSYRGSDGVTRVANITLA